MQWIIDMLHKNFQEDQTNSRRFPGFLNSSRFPGVVDTLTLVQAGMMLTVSQFMDTKSASVPTAIHCEEPSQACQHH